MSFPPLAGHVPFYAVVVVVFLLMISVLVFAHEAGHYLFARLFNMGVEEFAIGFGKRPWIYARRKYAIPLMQGEDPHPRQLSAGMGTGAEDDGPSGPRALGQVAQFMGSMEGGEKPHRPGAHGNEETALAGDTYPRPLSQVVETPSGRVLQEETVFTIRPIPAGGFVRIKGMLPEEDGSETRIPGGFYSKAPWKRLIVLLAGPAFSVLAGILILVPVLMIDGNTKLDPRPLIGEVIQGKSADKAGLKTGDLVLSIQGTKVTTFADVLRIVTHSPGVPLAFVYERGGKDYRAIVTPEIDKEPTPVLDKDLKVTPEKARQGRIGTYMPTETVYPNLGQAVVEAAETPVIAVVNIAQILQSPSSFKDNVGGPGQMVEITAMAVQDGVLQVLRVMAILSISVGIFNLLPFPPLDGGQMVIALAEMLRGGRRLSMQIQGLVSGLGLLAVLSLVVSALYVDFQQITKPPVKPGIPQTVPVAHASPPSPAALGPSKAPAAPLKPAGR